MGEGSSKGVRHGWPAQGRSAVVQPSSCIGRSAPSSLSPPRAASRATAYHAASYHLIALESGGRHPVFVFASYGSVLTAGETGIW